MVKRLVAVISYDGSAFKGYQIQPYEIDYPQKFIQINHSAVLGTLANSGIDTDTFGDIITDGNGEWQFFAKKEGIQELLIFPEGKVIKEEKEIRKIAKKGVVFISASLNVPILPVNITRRPKFFSKVTVSFGTPYYIDKSILEDKSKIINESKKLVNTIYDLN